jgi:molybdate transport system regulatory protein
MSSVSGDSQKIREKSKNLVYEYKIWISNSEGAYILGHGGARLLELIDQTKDLGKAGKIMNMSYRKAWNMIQKIKENTGLNPVTTHRGGVGGGGGIELTAEGKSLVSAFTNFSQHFERAIEEFKKELNKE